MLVRLACPLLSRLTCRSADEDPPLVHTREPRDHLVGQERPHGLAVFDEGIGEELARGAGSRARDRHDQAGPSGHSRGARGRPARLIGEVLAQHERAGAVGRALDAHDRLLVEADNQSCGHASAER